MPGSSNASNDWTLAIPDRRGNRRVDTFHNVLEYGGVGLGFFVPGRRETLRVAGRAMIVRDFDVRSAMAEGGRIPELALVVAVEKAFFHCGKCITRSNLWNIEAYRGQAGTVPPVAPALDGCQFIWREAGSRLPRPFTGRLVTIIGNPFAGRRVTRRLGQTAWPGLGSSKSKCLTIMASTSAASCSAKVDPMHLRGPAPNGR